MGAILGLFGERTGSVPVMAEAMRRRGRVLYAADGAACSLGQVGPAWKSWDGDVEAGGRRFAVAFDGEIFNLPELQRGLERRGHRVGRVAEVLAALYREHGDTFAAAIDGSFALALSDGARLVLARDRYGVKPLYYSCADGELAFGSEIKSIVRGREAPAALDAESMRHYYVFGDHMLGDATLFAGIRQVQAGYCVVAERNGRELSTQRHNYVDAAALESACGLGKGIDAAIDEAGLNARLSAAIERNVRHFVEQVERPGVLLSGGFDSSVLAALAVRYAGKRVQTYTISDDPDFPDVVEARRVAAHLGTRHHEFIVSADAAESGWREGVHAYEDLIYRNTIFLLAKHVAGKSDLVLSGAGADFLGVPILHRGPRLRHAHERWQRLAAAEAGVSSTLAGRMSALRDDEARAIQEHFAMEYIPNQLFPSTERAMQYFGVEVAFPFACNLVHALSWRLPYRYREAEGVEKPLLRSALAALDLPREILSRPTFCSKGNLVRSKENLAQFAAGADRRELDRALPDAVKPFIRGNFQAMKLALLQQIFIEARGELR